MTNTYKELKEHVGHEIVCVKYGNETTDKQFRNIAIECETCNTVILDYDNPKNKPQYEKNYEKLHKIEDEMIELFLQDHDFISYVFDKYYETKDKKRYNNIRAKLNLPLIKL